MGKLHKSIDIKNEFKVNKNRIFFYCFYTVYSPSEVLVKWIKKSRIIKLSDFLNVLIILIKTPSPA